MKIEEQLLKALLSFREQGLTNEQIAARASEKIRQQQVNKLLNGQQSISKTQFSTVLALFPEVRRVLEEHFCKGEGANTSVGHAVNGNSNHVEGNITTNAASQADIAAAVDSALAHAADAVMQSSMCDACKLLAYPLIRTAARISQ